MNGSKASSAQLKCYYSASNYVSCTGFKQDIDSSMYFNYTPLSLEENP